MTLINIFKRVMLPCVLLVVSMLPAWGQELDMRGFEFFQHYYQQDFTQAIETGESILKDTRSFPILYYIYSECMIDCYNKVGDKKKAEALAQDVEIVCKDVDFSNINDSYNQLMELMALGNDDSEWFLGQNYKSTMPDIYEEFAQLDESLFTLVTEALSDLEDGQYETAKEKFKKVITLHGTAKDVIYGLSLDGLGICSQYLGNFPEAIDYYKEALQITKDIYGEKNVFYAKSLSNYGYCLTVVGDFKSALEQLRQSLKIREAIFPANHPDIAMSLGNIGFCFLQQGDYLNAVGYFEKALAIQLKNYNESHPDVVKTRANLALSYQMAGEKDKAKEQYDLISKYNKTLVNNDAAAVEIIRGNGCMTLKDYDEAIKHYNKSIEINKITVGEQHPDIVKSLKNLALCYYAKGDKRYFQTQCDAFDMEQDLLLNSLGSFNESLRNVYWNRYSYDFLSFYPDLIVSENRKDLAGDLYDKSALFAKGLMLSATTQMRRHILDSKDKAAIEQLNELETTRSKIDELKKKGEDTKSLEDKADKIESYLMTFLKDKNIDILQDLRITWQDVKANLKDDDIAIEFLTFDDPGEETPYYVALTIRNNYDLPHIIHLGRESALLKYTKDAYSSLEASAFIWGRFLFNAELNDVKNIYFSPSGELYNIAIESMPYWMDESKTVGDVYNIYRLSSTRELAMRHTPVEASGAAVYGGINYDAPVAAMGAPLQGGHEPRLAAADLPSPEQVSTQSRSRAFHVVGLEDGSRALQWDPLPAAGEEAQAVTSLLKGVMDTHLMTDAATIQATEASLKALSGQKLKIIHLATHGFYWNDSTALRHKDMVLMPIGYETMQEQDKSMVRAGLLFAGAQNTFFHKAIPEGVDDGVLTAQEVSHLDLRGLDLLVLSACQTGLGHVTGDGVFGLQRGFKKAGAQSIIMSLWPVSDKATQLMMTEFYKAWASGKGKREAFLMAQKAVREKYGNYEDENQQFLTGKPHWAAFILLDALE